MTTQSIFGKGKSSEKVSEDSKAPSDGESQADANATTAQNGPEATQQRLDQSENLKPLDTPDSKEKVQTYAPAASQEATESSTGTKIEDLIGDRQKALLEESQAQAAANNGVGTETAETIYSSHPIQNLQIGPYHFVDSTLKLNAEQAAKFDELLKDLPLSERRNIAKLDTAKVDSIVQTRAAATKQFDSSVGKEALALLKANNPTFGTESIEGMNKPTLGFANLPQRDNNAEVIVEGSTESNG